MFHDKILAFGESELAQFGKEDLVTWPRDRIVEVRAQHADTGDPARLLRPRRERQREPSAANQPDELAPFQWQCLPCFQPEDTTAGDLLHCGISSDLMVAMGQTRRIDTLAMCPPCPLRSENDRR
jgi:hypothetical protein